MALKVYKYCSCGMKSGTIQAAPWHFSISAKRVENILNQISRYATVGNINIMQPGIITV
jgi:hypothetical protein